MLMRMLLRRWSRPRPTLGRQRHHGRRDPRYPLYRSFRLGADILPRPRLARIDIDREENLAVGSGYFRQDFRFGQSDAAR